MNRTETARLRRALRRRPTVADRVRVALARALSRAAQRLTPRPSPIRATDAWNG